MKSMKQLAIALALVGVAMPAGRALAGPIGDTGQFNQVQTPGGYSTGSGGEFTVYGYTNLSNAGYAASTKNIYSVPSFQTFCIEAGENTGSNPTYFEVNDTAVNGGPLTKGTQWLYSQFALGTLANYDYTPGAGRQTSAGDLQKAIWYLEGESGGVANAFYNAAVAALGGVAQAQAFESGYLGVYVLNTYANANLTGNRQDFLYRVPDGGTTLALLGGALMGLGLLRRKFSI